MRRNHSRESYLDEVDVVRAVRQMNARVRELSVARRNSMRTAGLSLKGVKLCPLCSGGGCEDCGNRGVVR